MSTPYRGEAQKLLARAQQAAQKEIADATRRNDARRRQAQSDAAQRVAQAHGAAAEKAAQQNLSGLVFAVRNELWTWQAGGNAAEKIFELPSGGLITDLAIDYASNRIFIAAILSDACVWCVNRDGGNARVLVGKDDPLMRGTRMPESIALSPDGRTLYAISGGTHAAGWSLDVYGRRIVISPLIVRMPASGGAWQQLAEIREPAQTYKMRRLRVDATNAQLYWTDWDRIQRMPLGGGEIETVVTEDAVQRIAPSGGNLNRPAFLDVAIDGAKGRVYWLDASHYRVCAANLDGSDIQVRQSVPTNTLEAKGSLQLDAESGGLFWTEPHYAYSGASCAIRLYPAEGEASPLRVFNFLDPEPGRPELVGLTVETRYDEALAARAAAYAARADAQKQSATTLDQAHATAGSLRSDANDRLAKAHGDYQQAIEQAQQGPEAQRVQQAQATLAANQASAAQRRATAQAEQKSQVDSAHADAQQQVSDAQSSADQRVADAQHAVNVAKKERAKYD